MKVGLRQLTRFFARKGSILLLESQSEDHPYSQKSYLAALPEAEIKAKGETVLIIENGVNRKQKANPWQALRQFRERHSTWLFGYLGYDLKNQTEELSSENPDSIGAADLHFMAPGFLLEMDRKTSKKKLLFGDWPDKQELELIENDNSFNLFDLRYQTKKEEYLESIKQAQRRIREGDFYEVNLSHQLIAEFRGEPLALYEHMKNKGPVPFGAFLKTDEVSVCCQSPERFLKKEGSLVFSQPMKGTSPRSKDKQEDRASKQKLASSEKERAENLMIVDLVRNDLSRVALPGTVKVPKLFEIETFATVHQMVSTVTAEVSEKDPIAILKACFPKGSMTGAPKISAMQVIEELENYLRGIYSGAVGYITPQGDFDFNVVIRTAIIKNDELYYSIGGAITADSNPEAEWEETLVKARALTGTEE